MKLKERSIFGMKEHQRDVRLKHVTRNYQKITLRQNTKSYLTKRIATTVSYFSRKYRKALKILKHLDRDLNRDNDYNIRQMKNCSQTITRFS